MSTRLTIVARSLLALSLLATVACYTEDDAISAVVARLTIDATSVDLGTRDAGGDVPVRVVTIRNEGDAVTGTLDVAFDSGATTGLTRSSGTTGSCGGHALLPGASCSIRLTLGGAGSGPQSGTLRVIDGADTLFAVAVQGAIRSALSIIFEANGAGHGTVAVVPTTAVHGCIGTANCVVSSQGAVCSATCGLSIDSPSITLIATPDASSDFLGFVRSPNESPCTGGVSDRCTLALTDLNSVTARFRAK